MDAYSTHEWRTRTRPTYLRSHPTCWCGAPATEADHVVPRRILVALGIHNPDAAMWMQPLCKPHHSVKTRKVDEPLLRRWAAGEDAQTLAEEAMRPPGVGHTT